MSYNTASIRQLLHNALDDEELKALCFDYFRPVYDKFTPDTSPSNKIHILIEYCIRYDQIDKLLKHLQEINPAQYVRFISSIMGNSPASRPTQSCSPWSDFPGSEIAVRFTPKSYPVKLSRVKFYISPVNKPWAQFGVRIYDDDKIDEPGVRLDKENIVGAGTTGEEWVEIDISRQNIIIEDGDFYVSMYWLTPPGEGGKNAQSLSATENKIIPGRTYFKFGGSEKWLIRHNLNCQIQVVVNDNIVLENL